MKHENSQAVVVFSFFAIVAAVIAAFGFVVGRTVYAQKYNPVFTAAPATDEQSYWACRITPEGNKMECIDMMDFLQTISESSNKQESLSL